MFKLKIKCCKILPRKWNSYAFITLSPPIEILNLLEPRFYDCDYKFKIYAFANLEKLATKYICFPECQYSDSSWLKCQHLTVMNFGKIGNFSQYFKLQNYTILYLRFCFSKQNLE